MVEPIIPETFPIVDLDFHGAALDELEKYNGSKTANFLAKWHITAIACLQFGAVHNLDGPGFELRRNGRPTPRPIVPELFVDPESLTFRMKVKP